MGKKKTQTKKKSVSAKKENWFSFKIEDKKEPKKISKKKSNPSKKKKKENNNPISQIYNDILNCCLNGFEIIVKEIDKKSGTIKIITPLSNLTIAIEIGYSEILNGIRVDLFMDQNYNEEDSEVFKQDIIDSKEELTPLLEYIKNSNLIKHSQYECEIHDKEFMETIK